MIVYRRAFAFSLAITLFVLLLAGCDLGAEAEPTADPATTTIAATASAGTEETAATEPPLETAVTETSTPEIAETPEPSAPQGGTLPIRVGTPLNDLRPWDLRSRGEEYAADLLYNGLVELDPALQPQPDLAESWEVAPDSALITFTLRSGIQWHDGTPLTGEDVAWTLNTLRAMTATNSLMTDLQSVIGDVRSPLETTVVISLTQPFAPLLSELTVPILPRHIFEQRGVEALTTLNFWDEPIGSGPFKVVERNDQGVTFARNESYFKGAPNLDGVALVVSPDDAITAEALNAQTLLVAEFPPTSTAVLNPSTLNSDLQRGTYLEHGSYFLAFNVRAERVFSDTRVRQALALAVDVPQLVQDVTQGVGQPVVSSILPGSWAYPDALSVRTPNQEEARRLLDEAGWRLPESGGVRERNGITLTAQLFVRGDDPRRVAAAERIVAAAGEVGMALVVAPADFRSVLLGKLAPPYEFDLILSSWVNAPNSSGYPSTRFYDPDDYALFGAERIWTGPQDQREGLRNIGGFSNSEYEQAAQSARIIFDPERRLEAIAAAQEVLEREVPYLYLWADGIPVYMSSKVAVADGDIQLDSPRYLWNIEQWYLKP